MPLLWVALRLILGINVRVDDTSGWTRMIWRCPPEIIQQFLSAQFLEHDATPILRRTYRPQAAFAFPAVLITENAGMAQPIAA